MLKIHTNSSESDRPLVLIVDDERIGRDFAAHVLTAAQWRVETAEGGEKALAELAQRPDLILMDLHMAGMSGLETVAAIRAGPAQTRSVPILAYTTTPLRDPATLRAAGFDGFVPKPSTPDELVAATARWRPDGAAVALDWLASQFGQAQIGDMVDRLRTLFEEALAALDAGEPTALAHRVAGIAGTLGFAAAGRVWLSVSEGDLRATANARRETRRAIAAIDRRRD